MSDPKTQEARQATTGPAGTPGRVRSATPAYPLPTAPNAGAAAPSLSVPVQTAKSSVPLPASPMGASAATPTATTRILTPLGLSGTSSPSGATTPQAATPGRTLTPTNQPTVAVVPASPVPATSAEASGTAGEGAGKTFLLDGSMLEGVRARAIKGRTATPAVPVPATPATPVSTTPAMPAPTSSPPAPSPVITAISVRTGRSVPAVSPSDAYPARPGVIAATYQVMPARVDAKAFDLPEHVDSHLPMLREGSAERAASFRALRRRLAEQKDPRTILVTSAQDDEGKTTCAANLALALAESGRLSVLLVEANLRRPKVAAIFGFKPSRCFREQMAAHREQVDSPWSTIEVRPTGLQVLALAPDAGGNDSLHGPTFSASVARWRCAFDYVVIDGPAILQSCDASIIHDSVDAVVMVVRSGVSRNRTVKRALEQISADMVAGMVLMDSTAR
jgi:Mrp family chromosome partitioning ATPase